MAEEKKTTRRKRRNNKKTNPSAAATEAIKVVAAEIVEADKVLKETQAAEEAIKQAEIEAAAVEAKAKEDEATKKAEPKKSVKPNKINLPEVEKLKIMLKEYSANAPRGIATATIRERNAQRLVKLVTYIANNARKEVLNEVYDFFKQERLGLMSETHVLQGTVTLNAATRERVELLYGALALTMQNATAKKKVKPNIELLTKRFGDGVAAWFASKNK